MQKVSHYVIKTDANEIKINLGTLKSETFSDRDAGFCSGEETDLDTEFQSSPTDTSGDSCSDNKDYVVDHYRTGGNKNKRKRAEPRKVDDKRSRFDDDDIFLPKLIKLENGRARLGGSAYIERERDLSPFKNIKVEEVADVKPAVSPFRPWSSDYKSPPTTHATSCASPNEYSSSYTSPPVPSGYVPLSAYANYVQDEPLSLVVDKKTRNDESVLRRCSYHADEEAAVAAAAAAATTNEIPLEMRDLAIDQQRPQEVVRIAESDFYARIYDTNNQKNVSRSPLIQQEDSSDNFTNTTSSTMSPAEDKQMNSSQHSNTVQQQRNYKNMTRERRIEANARERTRVHTISAAFETLRKCVPAYANNQKLSKLSVLRIACSYIMTLSRVSGYDYSIDQSAPSIAECIDNVCSTIQLEGKTRKKKDD